VHYMNSVGEHSDVTLESCGRMQALAEISSGKKKVLVPYRDSILTKLLQNALGGNRFVRAFVNYTVKNIRISTMYPVNTCFCADASLPSQMASQSVLPFLATVTWVTNTDGQTDRQTDRQTMLC